MIFVLLLSLMFDGIVELSLSMQLLDKLSWVDPVTLHAAEYLSPQ